MNSCGTSGYFTSQSLTYDELFPFSQVKKLFIFFTDGKNTNPGEDLSVYSNRIKNIPGMTSIAVGVGNAVSRDELLTIASSPNEVFEIEEFEELKLLIDKLSPRECKEDDFP